MDWVTSWPSRVSLGFCGVLACGRRGVCAGQWGSIVVVGVCVFGVREEVVVRMFALVTHGGGITLMFISCLLITLTTVDLLAVYVNFTPNVLFTMMFKLVTCLVVVTRGARFRCSCFSKRLHFTGVGGGDHEGHLKVCDVRSMTTVTPTNSEDMCGCRGKGRVGGVSCASNRGSMPCCGVIVGSPSRGMLVGTRLSSGFLARIRGGCESGIGEERRWLLLSFRVMRFKFYFTNVMSN